MPRVPGLRLRRRHLVLGQNLIICPNCIENFGRRILLRGWVCGSGSGGLGIVGAGLVTTGLFVGVSGAFAFSWLRLVFFLFEDLIFRSWRTKYLKLQFCMKLGLRLRMARLVGDMLFKEWINGNRLFF